MPTDQVANAGVLVGIGGRQPHPFENGCGHRVEIVVAPVLERCQVAQFIDVVPVANCEHGGCFADDILESLWRPPISQPVTELVDGEPFARTPSLDGFATTETF